MQEFVQPSIVVRSSFNDTSYLQRANLADFIDIRYRYKAMLSSNLQHLCFQMMNALQKASKITPPYYI